MKLLDCEHNRFVWICFLVFFCLLISNSTIIGKAPPESQLMKRFEEGKNAILSGEIEQSRTIFTGLIQELESQRLIRDLTPDEEKIYTWCLDYLGRIALQQQNLQEAEFYYLTLIQMNPFYQFPDTPPPSVQTFFKGLLRKKLGYLSLTVEPGDAVIYLDNRRVGQGGITSYPVPEGTYSIRIRRAGYADWAKVITVRGGKEVRLGTVQLQRTSSALFVATSPPGVEVYLDGNPVGITKGQAPEQVRSYAISHNLDPSQFSDYLAIPIQDTFEHYLDFKKPCYESEQIIIQAPPLQDIFLEPVILDSAIGSIQLDVDASADIYIDGEFKGKTGKYQIPVCAGPHDLTLKNSWALWSKKIQVNRGEQLKIQVHMKPRVLFLGILAEENVSRFAIKRAHDVLQNIIKNVKGVQIEDFEQGTLYIQEKEVPTKTLAERLLQWYETQKTDETLDLLKNMASSAEARLFLVGRIPREDIPRHFELYLFSNLSPFPDFIRIDHTMKESVLEAIQRFDEAPPVIEKIFPFKFIWTQHYSYPFIYWVSKDKSPSKIKPGMFFISVEGIRIDSYEAFRKAFQQMQTKNTVKVQVGYPGKNTVVTVDVPLIETPAEVDTSRQNIWLNRIAIEYLRWVDYKEESVKTHVARLNLGLVLIRMGQWSTAFEWFTQVQFNRKKGISQPTVLYHLIETYLELGYRDEALGLIERLKKEAGEATLVNDLGWPVKEAIKELEALLR